ncbi:hypothetical protein LB467_05670 [Salegentibacter sp. JZCK2]|uniref:hypothetical protein n=1 Tax=Salegentibacter tibetensis TaxID=2873600 RepID=UPI001CCEC7C2|nr:hypothetical protein [Salegentibacter tibetensis]MBZ9729168.1 hypothetical protein [Salegentibacter tibetensis]
METKELRIKISEKLEKADPDFLKAMLEFIEKYDADKTVAYKADGSPVSYAEYHKDLQESINQVAEGKTISQKDLEEESRDW